MKKFTYFTRFLPSLLLVSASLARAEDAAIEITKTGGPGHEQPILVSLSGFTGEAAEVLQFDLYVQGFAVTNEASSQYVISGSNNGNLQGRVVDHVNKSTVLAKAYSGGSVRRQAHTFIDDFVQTRGRKPIGNTRIGFKGQNGSNGEIYIADFDGFNPQQVTRDSTIVAAPSMVPGHLAMYYTSYKFNHPDIFYQNLSSGARTVFARYGGSNLSPAVSPDGSKVAMILSKDGWTDLYVSNSDKGDLRRLTRSPQDESSPCWSPDGQWICYASKESERRSLSKISVSGGSPKRIPTNGAGNPSEPDWSPDGKWIAFTSQARDFSVCVVPATGGDAIILTAGEDPSWSPNSRTLAFARRQGGTYVLSLLDVPTKQVKDVSRTSGSSSQSQPSWAR